MTIFITRKKKISTVFRYGFTIVGSQSGAKQQRKAHASEVSAALRPKISQVERIGERERAERLEATVAEKLGCR